MHGGVAMIDVSQFKSVNASFGHLVGGAALQTVAAAMQSCLRLTDILIRYGGDDFLLLMPQNCPDGVESVIRRVQNAVQAARVPSHPELRLSVSIGGVCNVQPLTEAIRQADARMYCNKENGEPVLYPQLTTKKETGDLSGKPVSSFFQRYLLFPLPGGELCGSGRDIARRGLFQLAQAAVNFALDAGELALLFGDGGLLLAELLLDAV